MDQIAFKIDLNLVQKLVKINFYWIDKNGLKIDTENGLKNGQNGPKIDSNGQKIG